MVETDIKGHAVPSATGESPARAAFLRLSRSILDPIPVANASGRTAALAALAGSSPAIAPSSSNPVFFYQHDLPKAYRLLFTVDGTNFFSADGTYVWANATARGAATGAAAGDKGYQVDTGITFRYNGSAWKEWESDWTSYVPTLTNFTIGTGGVASNTAQWRYFGGRVQVRGVAKLGTSGASVSGTINITLPVNRTALNHNWQGFKGNATFYDDNTGVNYIGFVVANTNSVTGVTLLASGASPVGIRTPASATAPFTWAAADAITYDFEYDPA